MLRPISLAAKSLSVARGFALKETRVESAQRLLSYFLSKLTDEERAEHLQFAPALSPDALAGSRLYSDRVSMLHSLPKGGVVAEVGVYQGHFTLHIAEICRPDKIVLIDVDFSRLRKLPFETQKVEGDSSTILSRMPKEHFDWLYIDADHSYEGVMKDLAAAHHCLKPGGYLVCNDYTVWCTRAAVPYGVPRAVNEFVSNYDYSVRGLALECAGMHDLLIQKPA